MEYRGKTDAPVHVELREVLKELGIAKRLD